MKIYSLGAKNIINIISKCQENGTLKKDMSINLLKSLIITYFFINKFSSDFKNEKKIQNELMQKYFVEEGKLKENKRIFLSKERNPYQRNKMNKKYEKERSIILNQYREKPNFITLIEPTYNSFIPNKHLSIPLEFFTKKLTNSLYLNTKDEKNKKDEFIIKGKNNFIIDIPITFFEDKKILDDKEINKEKEELKFLLTQNDDKLFYEDEKMDMNKSKKILKTKNIKNGIFIDEFSENNDYYYNEFNSFLSKEIYMKYIQKMNYCYLHIMLMHYFDLESKINSSVIVKKNIILTNYVKNLILQSGICSSNLYEKITKNVLNQKHAISFDNFLEYFEPIFKITDDNILYKYKFILNLCRNGKTQTFSNLEYDMFLNLIKAKSIFNKDIYTKIITLFKSLCKSHYPKEDSKKEFDYIHINLIIEFIIEQCNI